ncbi:MAG: diaminopimelate decarboxylase [Candidatus Colwellbacteria bacterium]|nr:diaminopimelate decarboxylase [Candidatus Colwellbacteria bacterium]
MKSLVKKYGAPLYVYEARVIKDRYQKLAKNLNHPRLRIHYAVKANSNLEILRYLRKLGAGAETVSLGEVLISLKAGFKPKDIIYTCSNITKEELETLNKRKIRVNLDSLNQIKMWGELAPGTSISFRVNQGIGAGNHHHFITGGPESKFGIDVRQINKALALAKKYKLTVNGIQQHIGSGILNENKKIFIEAMMALLHTARRFPDLEFIDFGGGIGIPYRPNEKPLDLNRLGRSVVKILKEFEAVYGRKLNFVFEPGRYLIAEAGTLLVTVTDIKINPSKVFIGVNSGFNHLIRPAMYDSYHEIVNLSRQGGKKIKASIVGNICESADFFAKDRPIPLPKIGDALAILNAGAYGFSMSSNYNLRPRPAEVLIEANRARLIRRREKVETIIKN